MKRVAAVLAWCLAAQGSAYAQSGSFSIGAAPMGDAAEVALRVIKDNVPNCKRISEASRLWDGSIRATCAGTIYRVFTVHHIQDGKTLAVVLNCEAAASLKIDRC